MDLYHCQIVEGDVSTKLKKYLKKVGHVQVASVPERHEPNTGELDYNYVLALMEELGYEGWIGCEYRPKGPTSEGLDWLRKRQ
jgi:2-dehydrotetronate isomerase